MWLGFGFEDDADDLAGLWGGEMLTTKTQRARSETDRGTNGLILRVPLDLAFLRALGGFAAAEARR